MAKNPFPAKSPFKNHSANRKPERVTNKGKGGQSESLPSRFSRDSITGADPLARTMGHYGKQSPYTAGEDVSGMNRPGMPMPPLLARARGFPR